MNKEVDLLMSDSEFIGFHSYLFKIFINNYASMNDDKFNGFKKYFYNLFDAFEHNMRK